MVFFKMNTNKGLLDMQNKFQGREGYIVATGPSIANKDMGFLENEITLGLNLVPLMFDMWGFLPTFNLVADKYVWPKFQSTFETLLKNQDVDKLIIASACDTFPIESQDNRTYMIPKKMPQEVIKFSENPISDGFYRGKTVTYDAVQFAFFLGFDKVYILGMDFSVNHEWGKNGHCYEIQRNPKFSDLEFPNTQSHVIQRGLPGNPQYADLIRQYFSKAREHYENAGRELIIDNSSHLDVLEKEKILK